MIGTIASRNTLRTYVEQHPDQTPEVAEHLRTEGLGVLDYVKQAIMQSEGFDRKEAFMMMDDLRSAVRALSPTWNAAAVHNLEQAKATVAELNEKRQATVPSGETIHLAPGSSVATPTDKPVHPHGGRATYQWDPENGTARVLGIKLSSTAEEAHLGDKANMPGTSGLKRTLQLLDAVTPLVQTALTDRNVDPILMGHEATRGSESFAAASTYDKKLFHTTATSSQSASRSVATDASWNATLIEVYRGLQGLQDQIDGLRSYPGTVVPVMATHRISETALLAVTTPKRFRHPSETVERTVPVTLDWHQAQDESREVAQLADMPAHIAFPG